MYWSECENQNEAIRFQTIWVICLHRSQLLPTCRCPDNLGSTNAEVCAGFLPQYEQKGIKMLSYTSSLCLVGQSSELNRHYWQLLHAKLDWLKSSISINKLLVTENTMACWDRVSLFLRPYSWERERGTVYIFQPHHWLSVILRHNYTLSSQIFWHESSSCFKSDSCV